jgi:hypothetical protein
VVAHVAGRRWHKHPRGRWVAEPVALAADLCDGRLPVQSVGTSPPPPDHATPERWRAHSGAGPAWNTRDVDVDVLFASVPVADLAPATAWYGQLLGRAPDLVPNEHEVMWRIADGAWLYVIVEPDRVGRTLITLCVADLDKATTALAQRGINV